MEAEEYKASFKSYPEPIAKPWWVLDYDRITVHTQGRRPHTIIDTARPNEPSEVRDYRIANFRAVTMDAFVTAKTTLKRTLSHSAVEIVYPDGVKEFLNEPNFRKTNFLSYMQQYVVDKMIDAANGLLVWWPVNVGDTSQRLSVEPIILLPSDILHYDSEVLTFKAQEKSLVTVAGEERFEGEVYYIILEQELWKRKQVGKIEEEKWEWEAYAQNPFGSIYALPLGGEEIRVLDEKTKQEISYFTSFFRSAVEFGDECLCRHSDTQGTWISCASPIREVDPIDCLVCNQTGSVNHYNQFTQQIIGKRECGSCQGKGYILPTSSYGYIVRPKHKGNPGDADTVSEKKAIEFLHPEVSILDFGDKSWTNYKSLTEKALNLLFIEEAQSGIAKEIDREDKLAMLDRIAVHLYKYLITQSINIIHTWLYPAQEVPAIQINLPVSFVVKKAADIQAELELVKKNGAPAFLVGELQREVTFKTFAGDPVRMKMFDVNMSIDPLFTYTIGEKNQMLAAGSIDERQWTISIYAPSMIAKYARENRDFVEQDVDTIIDAVTPLIEEKIIPKAEPVDAFPRA